MGAFEVKSAVGPQDSPSEPAVETCFSKLSKASSSNGWFPPRFAVDPFACIVGNQQSHPLTKRKLAYLYYMGVAHN